MLKSRLDHHTPKYGDSIGNFHLSYHLEMVKDQERVKLITAALDEALVDGGIHCELGIGTGIFAIYAAKRCKKVYALEKDPDIFEFAKQNISKSPYQDKIELILVDAFDFQLAEKADSLLVEMMSIWGINEPQIPVMNHAIQAILKPDGQAIPRRIVNVVELGYYDFKVMGVECKASIPQFTGIAPPRIMTRSCVFNTFDLTQVNPTSINHSVPMAALMSGRINCARLSSLVQLSENITFFTSDSLMPQTIVPLNELQVKAGDQITFSAAFDVRSNLEESVFEIG